MRINEIFYSIQGEGAYQGIPMIFIRLQGCNLLTHCVWCDTSYAWDGNLGEERTIESITDEVITKFNPRYQDWICITGGEPLFQLDELELLIRKLKHFGFRIEVETNGSIKKPYWWTLVNSWVADIKCPSSGVCGVSLIDDWFKMRGDDQVKFVVGTREDLEFARKVISSKVAYNPVVLVSPVIQVGNRFPDSEVEWRREWFQEVAEFCKEMRVRYSLQLHKVIWGNRKGV